MPEPLYTVAETEPVPTKRGRRRVWVLLCSDGDELGTGSLKSMLAYGARCAAREGWLVVPRREREDPE